MEKADGTSVPYIYQNQISWIIPCAVIVILGLLTLWIIISLIHFGLKTGKWRKFHGVNPVDSLSSGWVYTSVIICGCMVLLYLIAGLVYINIGYGGNQDEVCDIISDVLYSLYALMYITSILFFWSRQRMFFQNPVLNVHYHKCVNLISFLSLFIIIFMALGVLVFVTYPDDHESTTDGCVYNPAQKMQLSYGASIIAVVIFGNSLLWGLLLYATKNSGIYEKRTIVFGSMKAFFRKSSKSRFTSQVSSSSNGIPGLRRDQSCTRDSKAKATNRSKSADAMTRNTLKKTLVFAILATSTDVFLQIIAQYVIKPCQHRRYSVMAASISSFITLFLIVLSFGQPEKMLASFCVKYQKGNKV